jgi:hypothetical protein
MPDITAHDWFRPRLAALFADAVQAGYPRDVAEAVITDLVNGTLAASEPPPEDSWAQDPGEPPAAASEMPLHTPADTDSFDASELLGQTKIRLRSNY